MSMEQVLYSLPDGWGWRKLSELANTTSGGTPSRPNKDYWGGSIPWVKSGELGDGRVEKNGEFITESGLKNSSAKLFPKESLLLALYGATAGKLGVLTYDAATNQAVCCISQDDQLLERDFLRYYLLSQRKKIIEDSFGGAQPNISQAYVREIDIPTPPLTEQKRIVEKLDALLTRIDTAIEHLHENLANSKPLLASALFEKFHQEINPTPIKDIFNVFNGRAYKKPELLDAGKYKVIRIQNLKGGKNYYYSDLELDENKYCESGDLLFSWSGTPGTSFGAFIWNDEKAIYHYHIWKMEPKVDIAPRYAYWVLKDITEEAIANARGVAGMLHITKGTMESFIVSLPSYEAQQKIAKELDELAFRLEQLQAEISSKIDSLKHLKASILDSAFKGEL